MTILWIRRTFKHALSHPAQKHTKKKQQQKTTDIYHLHLLGIICTLSVLVSFQTSIDSACVIQTVSFFFFVVVRWLLLVFSSFLSRGGGGWGWEDTEGLFEYFRGLMAILEIKISVCIEPSLRDRGKETEDTNKQIIQNKLHPLPAASTARPCSSII